MKYRPYPEYRDSEVEWFTEVPSHWKVIKLGQLALMQEGPGLRNWQFKDQGTRVICVTNITEQGIDFSKLEKFISNEEYMSTYQHFTVNNGDILLSSSGNSWGKVAEYCSDEKVILNTSTIRLNQLKHKPLRLSYIQYFLASEACREQLGVAMTGSCQPNFGPTHLKEVKTPIPTDPEQQTIANFLDHETAKIDTLIEKQQQLIKLLLEKRQSVISHAVTKGLNPNAPMRDSGVEWLGVVPEHWNRIKLKHITNEIIDAEHRTAEYFDDGEYLVCRTTNVRDGQLRLEGGLYTNLETYTEWTRRGVPEVGDILFTREAPAGEACVYTGNVPLCLGQRMVLFKLKTWRVDSYFILHSIYSGLSDDFVKQLSQGSTVAHFNMADIQNIPLFEPPLDEQLEITEYLANALAKYDALIQSATNAINLMQERRTALISAAVTGKIDVRNWIAPESANCNL